MSEAATTAELSRFAPLNSLGPENLKELAGKSRRTTVPAGKTLVRDDQDAGGLLFVSRGSVELERADGSREVVEGQTDAAASALNAPGNGIRRARAKTDVKAILVDRDLLDLMLTWDQTGSYHVEDLDEADAGAGTGGDEDWMSRLLQTECFRRIPPANIQAIFMRMEAVRYEPGEVVIRQGDDGDYFYMISEGRCLVTRATKAKPDGVRLAELDPGDSFGEEALISNNERNATVTMLSRGTLMRLSKQDFDELLKEPLLQWIDYGEAASVAPDAGQWIDVRLPAEFEAGHVAGAVNIPLIFLRMKAQKLDRDKTYVVYCDSGRRSSAAAFILSDRGFDARVLTGGLERVPNEAVASKQSA